MRRILDRPRALHRRRVLRHVPQRSHALVRFLFISPSSTRIVCLYRQHNRRRFFSTGPRRKPRTRSARTPRTKPSSSPTTPSRTSGWRTWVARRAASGPTCTRTRARRTTAADTTATTSVRRTAKCTGLHRTPPDSTGHRFRPTLMTRRGDEHARARMHERTNERLNEERLNDTNDTKD